MSADGWRPIADLHSHALIGMGYWRRRIGLRHRAPAFWNPLRPHQDLVRAREGGVGIWVFTVYSMPWPVRQCPEPGEALRLMDCFDRFIAAHGDRVGHARSSSDITAILSSGRIACLLAIEGGHTLAGDVANVERFRERGVVYLTLTHFIDNGLATTCHMRRHRHEPLTGFGREVLAEMARVRMIPDVAHLSQGAFEAVVETTTQTLWSSHTGIRSLCDTPRNLSEPQIREIHRRGGLIGVIAFPPYLGGGLRCGLERMVDHAMAVHDLVGPDPLVLGTDFDAMSYTPAGLPDQAALPRFFSALSQRGLGPDTLRAIAHGNLLRALAAHWG